jgi:hypothetical protein
MNVAGKFQGGDTWPGMCNGPGEWCIAYHGTKIAHVKNISETRLQAGPNNWYGFGIYCSPNPAVSKEDTDCVEILTRTGTVKCQYMFICRVYVRSIHHCEKSPCPLDQDRSYTLHMTISPDIWFVNCPNKGYQNIRPYGLLVQEV